MKQKLVLLILLGWPVLALLAGCSKGGERVEFASRADDIKASLRLPPGWAVEGRPGEMFVLFSETENPENRGSITIYLAEGKDLDAWTDTVLAQSRQMTKAAEMMGEGLERAAGRRAGKATRKAFSQKTLSRTSRKIGKREAIEFVEEAGGKKVITVVAKKGDRVCMVFFASVADQWAENEPLFRRSLDSLRIR